MSESANERESDVVDSLFAYLDRFMDGLHDRVLRPILLAGRFVAYGLILVLVTVIVVSALLIALVRFSTTYLFDHRVWITYLVVSFLSLTAGLIIWRKRRPVALRK